MLAARQPLAAALPCAPPPAAAAVRRPAAARAAGRAAAAAEPAPPSSSPPSFRLGGAAAAAAAAAFLGAAGPAAAALHAEPANALSLPTWAVHTSSLIEWAMGMVLMWRYADVSGQPAFKGLAWGMLPALMSAAAALTWHFFYNAPTLQWVVVLQAALTLVGNFTLWWAAYRIYAAAQRQREGEAS
jgi:hypothetical protein